VSQPRGDRELTRKQGSHSRRLPSLTEALD